MKVSQKQATLLAKEIFRQLEAKKTGRLSDLTKAKLDEFVSQRETLEAKVNAAKKELEKHENTITKIIGNIRGVYGSDSLAYLIKKTEQANMPSIQAIEDEIILKSMFNNEEDMEKFVKSIVDHYSKKLQNKILSN